MAAAVHLPLRASVLRPGATTNTLTFEPKIDVLQARLDASQQALSTEQNISSDRSNGAKNFPPMTVSGPGDGGSVYVSDSIFRLFNPTSSKMPARKRFPPLGSLPMPQSVRGSHGQLTQRSDGQQSARRSETSSARASHPQPGAKSFPPIRSGAGAAGVGASTAPGALGGQSTSSAALGPPQGMQDPHKISEPQRVQPPAPLRTIQRLPAQVPAGAGKLFSGVVDTSKGAAGGAGKDEACQQLSNHTMAVVKDYATLALACQRAGILTQAATALYNTAVVFDNHGQLHNAIDAYKKFLAAAIRSGDHAAEALAYNCIAVDYHKMGPKYLDSAIRYHLKHLSVADDYAKVVAHFNLGLAYDALEDVHQSVQHHQYALQFAIRESDLVAEALACANLGTIASRQGDYAAARSFLERYLHLGQALRDAKAKAVAYLKLGELAAALNDLKEAGRCFEKAVTISRRTGEREVEKTAECNVGVTKGSMRLTEYMNAVAAASQSLSSPRNPLALSYL